VGKTNLFKEGKKMKNKKTLALLSLLLIMSMIFSACGTPASTPDTPSNTGDTTAPADDTSDAGTADTPATPSNYQQSPYLDGQSLPPVDERLPSDPLVVVPYEKVGAYGGTWTQSVILGNRLHALAGLGQYEGRGLVVWDMELKEIIPNIAASWEMSADAMSYTFTLREGLKWSDGHPMTTDDILFWFEARESNLEINPGYTGAASKVVSVDVADELTFTITYNVPAPLAIYGLASFQWNPMFLPKHYLSQFHIDYSDNAEELAEEAGMPSWAEHFGDRADQWFNHEVPTMAPFILMNESAGAASLMFERNPYFWAVDTEGNQLPYIDEAIVHIVEDGDTAKMRAIAGEFDLQHATVTENFLDFPLFAEHADSAGYQVFITEYAEPNAMNIHLNIAHEDPGKRAIFGSSEFRHAISYTLDRDTIIGTLFTVGPHKSTPRNFSPAPNSLYFDEAWSSANTTFDLDIANEMLDELGLDKRNSAGFRLMPNGEELVIVIDVPNFDPSWIDVGIMVADCLVAAGINASATSIDPPLWGERREANDFDMTMMTGGGGFPTVSLGNINDYTGAINRDWPVTFQFGYINMRMADEDLSDVPPEILELWELGTKIIAEPNADTREKLLQDIFDIHRENLFILGIGTRLPGFYLVKDYVHNVPHLDLDWSFGNTGHGRPSQYFFEQ